MNKLLCGTAWRQGGYWGVWFRVFGYGLVITTMQPMFGERNGNAKVLRVFGVKVGFLRP